jgi:CRISPR system Cascade subunit CasA
LARRAGVFNLLDDSWLPVRRADGRASNIRPADLTSDIENNSIFALDWPRPDFRIACLEFLIGLIATACPPADDDDAWAEGWEAPPSPETLTAAFAPITHAFNLDGPGPRFLQDLEELPGKSDTPETLLIEAPGEATRGKNTALLVKPGRITCLSRPAATMSLFTLQCYAPSGGRGNLTSVRGGGPLSTLVLPGIEDCPLWHAVWANVVAGQRAQPAELPRIFPWLAPTRTSDRFLATTPAESHPLQAFWGMPRRIRLDFTENAAGLPCDLTGAVDPVIVSGWRQRPNGVKYLYWHHPLSPQSKDKGGGWRPIHPQPGGIGYRHWVAIAVGDQAGSRRPARCIADWHSRVKDVPASVRRDSRLLAAGYDMDKMKARAFVESEMPLPGSDPAAAEALATLARGLVDAAEITARALRFAVHDALFRRDKKLDRAPLAAVYEAFWAATQDRFFGLLRESGGDGEEALTAAGPVWRSALRTAALDLFDEAAPLDPFAASFDPRRIVEARCNLFRTLEGRSAMGTKLFEALLLSSPEPKARSARRTKAKEPA